MPPFPSHEQEVPPGVLSPDDETKLLDKYNPDLPAFGTIGDDSAAHGQALAYLMRVGREAQEARETPVEQAVRNAKVYKWGQETEPQCDDVIANDIQSAVLSITDIQTREPFAIFIRPVQTRDKAQVYWIGPPVDAPLAMMTGLPIGLGMVPVLDPLGQPMQQPVADPTTGMPAVDPMTGAPAMQPMMQPADPNAPPVPLDEVSAWQVRKLAATGAFPSEWVFVLDDRAVADVYQTVFDVFWKEAKGDDFVRENLLHTNIYGYQTGYYSWDARTKQHILRHVSIKEAFLDPKWMTLDQMNYAGFEVIMDIDQAKAEYPQLASVIDDYAKIGLPSRVDSATEFGSGDDRQFWRRTVTFRVMFFRNQQVPMTPQEAIRAGLVVEGLDGYHLAQAQGAQDEQGQDAVQGGVGTGVDSNGDAGGGQPGAADQGDEANGGVRPIRSGPAGAGGLPMGEAAPAPQVAPQWPMTLGIRQIATLAQTGRIVQDLRLEHHDFPMVLNQCIPQPSQPFGQGLPEKLAGMQKADIRLLNSVVRYVDSFSTPGCMIPQSVAEALKGGLKRTHVDPTETLVVPDDLVEKWGEKAVLWNVPPALPPAVAQVMEMLDRRTKETSGHSEVLQGTAPSPSSSGRMVEALQAGAAGQFGFQAQWTAKMVERLANLMHYTHLWRLDLADVMEMYSRLPAPLLQMVIDRAQRNRWEIQVDANNGASGMRNRKLREALAMFASVSPKTGEPVMPLKMVREQANIDHEEASIAFKQEMENGMPMMPAAPGAPPPGQPGQGGPPSDGQGSGSPVE